LTQGWRLLRLGPGVDWWGAGSEVCVTRQG
jgi:hypothetical protein